MALSGTYDSTWTVTSIVTAAFKKCKVGISGEPLAAEELADGIISLQLMLRTWSAKGIRLWLNETQSITFVAGTATYTLSPRVIEVFQAYRRADSNDVPIRVVSRDEYSRFPDKTTPGAPFAVFIDRTRTTTTATFYPVPSATEVADGMIGRLDTKRMAQDATAGEQDIDAPPEWMEAVIYNLAVRLAPDYGQAIDPEVSRMARELYNDLEGQDRESSVIMRAGRRR